MATDSLRDTLKAPSETKVLHECCIVVEINEVEWGIQTHRQRAVSVEEVPGRHPNDCEVHVLN